MKNFCCQTWELLVPEITELLEAQYQELISKGIPKSALAANYFVLDNMDKRCPCHAEQEVSEVPRKVHTAPVHQEAPSKPISCRACEGTGRAGADKKSKILCVICHGKGVRDSSNSMQPVDPELSTKIELAKEKMKGKPVDPKSERGEYE